MQTAQFRQRLLDSTSRYFLSFAAHAAAAASLYVTWRAGRRGVAGCGRLGLQVRVSQPKWHMAKWRIWFWV